MGDAPAWTLCRATVDDIKALIRLPVAITRHVSPERPDVPAKRRNPLWRSRSAAYDWHSSEMVWIARRG